MRYPALIALALLVACFSLGVTVEPKLAYSKAYRRHDRPPVEVILGDSRRLFAGQFFVKADAYFHSGYYPSIFDQPLRENHLAHSADGEGEADAHHDHGEHEQGEHDADHDHDHAEEPGSKPLDFLDRFSRAFYPSSHTHLDEAQPGDDPQHPASGKVREMLPWLKMTAALDPNRIETYTVGAYWLRTRLQKPDEAESFLRDGLKENPGNPAILFELGRIYDENRHDPDRARNVWEVGVANWNKQELAKKAEERDTPLLLQLLWHLALVEERAGHPAKAISYLETAKTVSPNPSAVQQRIDELAATASGSKP